MKSFHTCRDSLPHTTKFFLCTFIEYIGHIFVNFFPIDTITVQREQEGYRKLQVLSKLSCSQIQKFIADGWKDLKYANWQQFGWIQKIDNDFVKVNSLTRVFDVFIAYFIPMSPQQYIENLQGCRRLQVLNLSFNQIQKMERLAHLTRLRELDLSCNCIARIEGLETLMHLQILNLSHNLIESIPAWVGKRLKALREFHIEGNMLFSVSLNCIAFSFSWHDNGWYSQRWLTL